MSELMMFLLGYIFGAATIVVQMLLQHKSSDNDET